MPQELALGVAMLTGLILIVLWLPKAGSMVRFISKPVLVGFLLASPSRSLTSQVEKIMNIKVDTGQWLTDVVEIVKSIPEASAASVVVGVSTMVIPAHHQAVHAEAPRPAPRFVVVGAVYLLDPGGVVLVRSHRGCPP